MTEQTVRRAEALRRIVVDGIEAALLPAGFEAVGKLTWTRAAAELQHVIALLARRGMYDVQWGVVSPEAVPFLWGKPAEGGDVGEAVMSGTPSSIHHPPAGQSFRLDASVPAGAIPEISAALVEDLGRVERRLRAFSTRRELRAYLMDNRDPKDRRDFIIPANLPLKLFTATTLAVIDGDRVAHGLLADTEQAMARYKDEISVARLGRLKDAVEGMPSRRG